MIERWTPGSFSIDASAGYGKTQRLCTRLLAHFLSDRDAARRTVAMTFTKPAAGEIYSRMLEILSSALRRDDRFDQLRRSLPPELSQVSREELHELLIRLINDMDKLNISTIDSFFYRLVRVFAVELGLPGRVELDEAGGESPLTAALLRELFGGSGASKNLLDACRDSRLGDERKTFFDSCMSLLRLVQNFRDKRDCPEFWGGRFAGFRPKPPEALKRALEKCDAHRWPDKYTLSLGPLLKRCAEARDPKTFRFTRDERNLLRKFCLILPRFPAEKPEGFKTSWDFAPVADELRLLIENGRDILLCQCAMRTAGLRILLDEYQTLYEKMMLRRGRITFADLPMLLAENSVAASDDERQAFLYEIQFRTNSRFLHFLIDEFQDTSRLQWQVLAPLVGDNGDGDHSLFIVGDVKQAIYGWREGDSRLMGEVTESEKLETDPLKLSYRYGPDICEALNKLFPGIAGCVAELRTWGRPGSRFFGDLLKRWVHAFQAHDTAKTDEIGEFEVLALAPTYVCTADPKPRSNRKFAAVAARMIFERLDRVGFFSASATITAAVLVRSNGDGIELRGELVKLLPPECADRVVWEGGENIVNDPLAATLIAFGVAIQHPADTFARETAALNLLLRELLPADEEERLGWLTLIDEYGIAGFLRRLLFKMDERARSMKGVGALSGWSPIENGDADDLLAFAEAVDRAGGSRDFIRFRDLAVARRKKSAAVAGKLQIMTIHHSKGLSFDLVFHPMFDPARKGTGNWNSPELGVAVTGGGVPGAPEWLLNAPHEEGMSIPEIADAISSRHADRCFEELCGLYVALTRAKRGVYVFLPPRSKQKNAKFHCDWKAWTIDKDTGGYIAPKKPGPREVPYIAGIDSCYMSDLVFGALFTDPELFPDEPGEIAARTEHHCGVSFLRRSFGETWYPKKTKAEAKLPRLAVAFRSAAGKLYRATPSEVDEGRKLYFALPQPGHGALLGTRIHEFFESIGRWSEFTPPIDTDPGIMAHYRACAANPELTALLDDACDELWRERPFDVVVGNGEGAEWLVSGCFDRVQIHRDARGAVTRACIIDYKSNQTDAAGVPQLTEHYREQLESYRQALAKLLGITPNLIECRLIFTCIGGVAEV